MNDQQLLRYSRHILLPEIGIEGQEKFTRAHALVIGAGGLGSPVALYLAASGIGRITICDGDTADLTNLQRQIVHRTDSIGVNKALSARRTLASINPEVEVIALPQRVDDARLAALVAQADVVLDCCDNFVTRHAVNRACVRHAKPLVSGAGVRFDGQVAVFDQRSAASPCYNCLFSDRSEFEETRCAVMGVFAPLVGIIGAVQAAEALKLVAGVGNSLNGRFLMLDALDMQWHSVKLHKDPDCRVCVHRQFDAEPAERSCA